MRIATFNILHGRAPVDGEVDLARYAAAITALDADVLALQEVDRDQPRSHGMDLTALAADAMGAREHRFVATMSGLPVVWTVVRGDPPPDAPSYGIALLSRFPVRSWRTLALPHLPGLVPAVFPGSHRPRLVLDEPRVAVVAVIEVPGGPLTVVATHLSHIPWWSAVQLRHLVRLLRPEPRPVVLLGDLNLPGARPARITGWRPLAAAPTFPATEPRRQLDHVLASGDVTAQADGRAMDLGLSDHRAVAVDVQVGPRVAVNR
nr:endonuclease/exonuclease/phosphatase family protein [Cellulomonas sp. KRMCY2]